MTKGKRRVEFESNLMNKYLEKRITRGTRVVDDMAEVSLSLEQFKKIMSKKFQKITVELKGLRSDYKSIDSCLTTIETKLDHIESFTTRLYSKVNATKEVVDKC